MTKTNNLLGSSASLDGILKMINDYYFSTTMSLVSKDDTTWSIVNGKGKTLESGQVKLKKGRYRFEMI